MTKNGGQRHPTLGQDQGVRVGAATSAMLLGLIYIVAAPTSYFRARIPFLAGSGGVAPLLAIFLTFLLASFAGLAVAKAFGGATIRGAVYPALASTLVVGTGAGSRLVPQLPESFVRWLAFVGLAVVCCGLLLRERRIARTNPAATS